MPTPDGSGQIVHPDYVAVPPGAGAAAALGTSWLAATPYPFGDATQENPSLFASGDGIDWLVPPGAHNPIAQPTGGYLSDPDVVDIPERGELWVYYRQVTSKNVVLLKSSSDGVHWTVSRVVAEAPSHEIVSPTIVRRAPNDWLMWAVNSGPAGCSASTTTVDLRRSTDGVTWSAPERVALAQPGRSPWHIDVQWIPSRQEFWALFNGKISGSCTTAELYLATSLDGVRWTTYPSPVLRAGALRELADVVYRATFAYDAATDLVTLWHSGARYTGRAYEWHLAYERRTRAALFAAANEPANVAASVLRRQIPPLDNLTAP